ncbi:TniQ protein [Paenibacillus sp. yr247]|uniref:TniQ family protein n=1 Tax=Paenibacillus sp. yr247 TaxID=1761880 RepID=UPI000883993C|nr:TniQ family protein [Paenibacillus sp. yr247]SDO30622.1 TniQ protein [Paenibacillus sp. yr247]
MNLKNQLDIYQDESLSSYLFRLSQCNHYPSVTYLVDFLGLSAYQAQNNEFDQEALSKLIDLNEGLVNFGIYNGCNLEERVGTELYTRIIMKNKVKYCPLCIQDKYFHRTIWVGIPCHLCIEHRVKLIDQCPQCGYLISMAAFISQKCDKCSFDYRETESLVIENTIFVESQSQIYHGFWNGNFLVLKNCNFTNFFKLAFHSFHLLNGASDYNSLTSEELLLFYNRSNGEKSGFTLANALANIYWMFNAFPNHFFIVLDDFLTRKRGQARYEKLKAFEELFNDQAFSWVEEAYNSYFIDQIDMGNVRRDFSIFKKNPSLLLKRTKMRREEVRQNTGIAYEKLHELNDFKELQLETKLTNGQAKYLIEKSTLDTFLNERHSLISRKEAGLILGINTYSVSKVVNAGYLTPIQVANSPIKQFQLDEVNKLMELCLGQIESKLNTNFIRFHDVLIKYSTSSLTIVDIIAFTLSGHLKPSRIIPGGNLVDNFYEENEIKACLELVKRKKQEEVGYFFQDVMKKLKIGEKRLWKVLNENGIAANFTLHMKDGRKRYYFKEDTISKIQKCLSSPG